MFASGCTVSCVGLKSAKKDKLLQIMRGCHPYCNPCRTCSLRSMNSYPKHFLGFLPVSPVHTSNRPQRSKKVQSSIAQTANGTQQDMRHVYKRMVVKCGVYWVYRQVCVRVCANLLIYLFVYFFIYLINHFFIFIC